VDEVVLILVAPFFLILYREPMREAWDNSQPLTR
jgi:hypothetical protein